MLVSLFQDCNSKKPKGWYVFYWNIVLNKAHNKKTKNKTKKTKHKYMENPLILFEFLPQWDKRKESSLYFNLVF